MSITPRTAIIGLAGLLVPGLGQLVRGQISAALFVLIGSVLPVFQASLVVNQAINFGVRRADRQNARTILEPDLWSEGFASNVVGPEVVALLLLGLTIYLVGAVGAAVGAGAGGTVGGKTTRTNTP